jgi:hypothetical protein
MARRTSFSALPKLEGAKIPQHAHGCTQCGWRYMDSCQEKTTDGLCSHCRTGQPYGQEAENRRPRPCCPLYVKLVVEAEIKIRYRLGGACTWWMCQHCYRTHPFKPTHEHVLIPGTRVV